MRLISWTLRSGSEQFYTLISMAYEKTGVFKLQLHLYFNRFTMLKNIY